MLSYCQTNKGHISTFLKCEQVVSTHAVVRKKPPIFIGFVVNIEARYISSPVLSIECVGASDHHHGLVLVLASVVPARPLPVSLVPSTPGSPSHQPGLSWSLPGPGVTLPVTRDVLMFLNGLSSVICQFRS